MISIIIKNRIINYVISRYAIYILQLVNTLVLAKILSPYYLGIWGFTQLIIVYFSHFDFGLASSFNALACINKNKIRYLTINFNSTLILVLINCLIVIFLFLIDVFFNLNIGTKYNFDTYRYYILIIIILAYFNKLFMNLYRVYNKLKEITLYQSIIPVMNCLTYIFFKENLIQNLLLSNVLANLLSLVIFMTNSPLKISFITNKNLLYKIQKSGAFFFIYNASFYFIILSTRTIVSYFYNVKEFGFFNFAYSLSNIIELSLNSILFLIFPKMINIFASHDNEDSFKKILYFKKNYTMLISVLTFLSLAFYPLFLIFYPEYENSKMAFNMIILTNLIYAFCFGSPEFLMARKKESKIALIAFFILITNIIITLCLVYLYDVKYYNVLIGTCFSYGVYVLFINAKTFKELNKFKSYYSLFIFTFPIRQFIPFIFVSYFTILNSNYYFFGIVLFFVLNFNNIIELKKSLMKMLSKNNVLDL